MLARKEETVVADENEQLASRLARIESSVAHIDKSVAILQVDFRELRKETGEGFKAVNARTDKHFLWLLSTMIALALTIGGALLKDLLAH